MEQTIWRKGLNLKNWSLVDNSAKSTEQKYNYYSCNDTFDKIFAISVKETTKYFSSYDKRQARGSDYALGNGLLDSHRWLRSPVANDASKAYYVYSGLILYDDVANTDGGIRPSCWIKL